MTSVIGHRMRPSWPHRPSTASQPESPTRPSTCLAFMADAVITARYLLPVSRESIVTCPPPLPGAKPKAGTGHKTHPVLNESGEQDGSEPSLVASSRFQRPGRPT